MRSLISVALIAINNPLTRRVFAPAAFPSFALGRSE
jgi:hypothetical protein